MKDTLEDLKSRRSCRKYEPRQISKDELDAVLEAAQYAPTGHGQQTPQMVVVQDPELIRKLSRLNAEVMGTTRDPFYGAPTLVIVFADASSRTGTQDACSVMVTLLNAAHAVGLGSCWINRAKEMFELPEGFELLQKWGIKDNYEGLAICILGYEAEGGVMPAKPRREGYVMYV